jgi:uncharacterized membrane protein
MKPDKKTRGRPKQELNDDVKRDLQTRQHNYYVNYKTKKNKIHILEPVQEIPKTIHEILNDIVKLIDDIKVSFNK